MLAIRIKRARIEAGLLQHELAEEIGRTTRSIQAWEAGRQPRANALRLVAKATGKEIAWFYRDAA